MWVSGRVARALTSDDSTCNNLSGASDLTSEPKRAGKNNLTGPNPSASSKTTTTPDRLLVPSTLQGCSPDNECPYEWLVSRPTNSAEVRERITIYWLVLMLMQCKQASNGKTGFLTFILRFRHVRQPVLVRRLISYAWTRPPCQSSEPPPLIASSCEPSSRGCHTFLCRPAVMRGSDIVRGYAGMP